MKGNLCVVAVSLLLGVSVASQAQVTTGTISGTVRDSTGAVVPGATVTIKNLETGLTRTVTADSEGRYRAPSLSLGHYQVQVEYSGFRTALRSGIELTVGREAVVNVALEVGAVAERVEVTGEAPLVESTSAAVGSLVDERTIRDLPLNGRSYDQLALLQAGVTAYGGGTGTGFQYGTGRRFSVAGGRSYNNSYLLDGTDINDAGNGAPGGAAGTNLGVDTIREFKILTNAYSAEYGRASGAVVNSVTKSGTNELHGAAFHFLRNSALDARNFFDREGVPPFKRNQFGGVLGGPVKRDRTFFFGAYEGLRQRLGTSLTAFVPTALAKQGILPTGRVEVSPAIRPFLALWPDPNGRDFGDGTAEFVSSPSNPTTEDYFLVRIDHQLNANNSLFGRYSFDDDSSSTVYPSGTVLVNSLHTDASRRQYSTVQLSTIFSPTLLNNFRVAYNRSNQIQDTLPTRALGPAVSFVPGQPIGRLDIGGRAATAARTIVGLGTEDSVPRSWIYNLFEWGEDLTYMRGRHSFKFGGNAKRIRDNTAQNTSLRGIYTFDSFADVLAARPANFAAVRLGQSAYRGIRQSIFAFYGQDDFQVNPRLTVNLGVRWEFATDPTESNHMVSNLLRPTDPEVTPLDAFFELGKKNVEPRVGFAWQLNSSGTSVLRGGFGIFHDQVLPLYYAVNVNKYPPFYELLNVAGAGNVRFPDAFRQLALSGLLRLNAMAASFKTPAKNHYHLSIQQQIFANTVLEVGYVGSKSSNLMRFGERNIRQYTLVNGQKFFPAGAPRINPNFDEIRTMSSDADGHYDAVQVKIRRASSRGLLFNVAYTFSKTIDEISGVATQDQARESQASLDPEDPGRDKARAAFDAAHNLVASLSYPIPLRFSQKAPSLLLGGWEVSAITTLTAGQPFSARLGFEQSRNGGGGRADRPDLTPGARQNPTEGVTAGCAGMPAGQPLATPDRWYDPCAFSLTPAGFYGNLGRNTLLGPGLRNFDLSLTKKFDLSERTDVQFRAEFFNLFNHTNFGLPLTVPVTRTGAANGPAGRITETTTTSRQIQFALKLTF